MTLTASRRRSRTSSRGGTHAERLLLPILAITLVIVGAQGLSLILPSSAFPSVPKIVTAFVAVAGDAATYLAVGQTLQSAVVGLAVALVLAVPIGLLLGLSRRLYAACQPTIDVLRPVPSVALIPLAVLMFGTGLNMKVFLIAFAAFWPLLFQTIYGVRDVDRLLLDTATAFGVPAWRQILRIVLPSTLPYLATGIRIAASFSFVLAVTGELVAGAPGLGTLVASAQSGGNIPRMYALIVVSGLLGWGVNHLLRAFEARILRWKVRASK